jgi:hypothetical protein
VRSALVCACVIVGAAAFGQEAEAPAIPFHMPVLDGWRTETIPFPLGFAPALEYEGLEELRFSPGMFDPESDAVWTYAFVWWVPRDTAIDAGRLSRDLDAYFRGLADAVAEPKKVQPDPATFKGGLRAVEAADGNPRFEGRVGTFDAFATLSGVELNVRAEVLPCAEVGQLAVLFLLSPQPTSHEVWAQLGAIRDGFRCAK